VAEDFLWTLVREHSDAVEFEDLARELARG